MKSGAVLAALLVSAVAVAEPAPRPPGWPSDVCVAEGADRDNPLCGTCSTSVVLSIPGRGTAIRWTCQTDDGWKSYGVVRPWLAPLHKPTTADIAAKGLWAALWDANAVVVTPETPSELRSMAEESAALLAYVVRPAPPPPPAAVLWAVLPVSTGLRPTYILSPSGTPVRETGKFVPTLTAGRPTACDCESPGQSLTLNAQTLCTLRGYTTAAGGQRFAACQPSQ